MKRTLFLSICSYCGYQYNYRYAPGEGGVVETHGICKQHTQEWLDQIANRKGSA